jgi:hypothetical protein
MTDNRKAPELERLRVALAKARERLNAEIRACQEHGRDYDEGGLFRAINLANGFLQGATNETLDEPAQDDIEQSLGWVQEGFTAARTLARYTGQRHDYIVDLIHDLKTLRVSRPPPGPE